MRASTGWTQYVVSFGNSYCSLNSSGHSIMNGMPGRVAGSVSSGNNILSVIDVTDFVNTKVEVKCVYRPQGVSKNFNFTRVVTLY